jgi:shikimate kinase
MTLRSFVTVHGAISIVNAVATGFGSALGISLKVQVELTAERGSGVTFESGECNPMIKHIMDNILPVEFVKENHLKVLISSEIPIGVGLKSSSAVSCAIALACRGLVSNKISDSYVLDSAINGSLFAKTTITGAYDDSTACYYGGFVTTDNLNRKLLRRDCCDADIVAIVHVPQKRKRGDISKLKLMSDLYSDAFNLANAGNYWKAMILNGLISSSMLLEDYLPARLALENGALAAGVSGNGPAVAAVAYKENTEKIRTVLEVLPGVTIVSPVNNEKATLVR